jgi:beta-exotoxin I transport system ATP-binding protein
MAARQAYNPLVATESLTKDYGRFRALESLNLRIAPGEVYGLLGPNGSGKSTALRIMLGFLRPTAGSASVAGHDCWSDSVAARRLVTYLPGELRLYENMTGRQIVNFLARLRGVPVDGEVDTLARRFEIDLKRPLVQLSSGMKRKVALLAVLAPRVPLVILDEPTNTLDPNMRDELLTQLRSASERGQTILFSSHVLAEVERVCHRVGILQRGKLVHEQTIAELQKASLVRVRFTRVPAAWPSLPGLDADGAPSVESTVTNRGPAGPLLEWLGEQEVAALRVEPLGLAGVYSQYHGAEA